MKMNSKWKRRSSFNLMEPMSTARRKFMTSRPVFRSMLQICVLVVVLILQGCTVGPSLYQSSFNDYNDAIRKTSDGQMLANLVRMRYLESPIFLQVASVSTSFTLSGNAGASATLNESASNNYGLSTGVGYSESPTITFSLPDSQEYYGRLLAPLSADQVTSLVLGGFDSELVFRTAARGINGLNNQNAEFVNSPEESSSYVQFREAFALIKKLRSEGIVDLELGGKEASWSSPVMVDAKGDISQVLLLGAANYAMSNDAEIVEYGVAPDGSLVRGGTGLWQTHMYEKHMALRFSPAAKDSPDAQRLKELLALKVDHYNFSIVEAELVNAEKARGILGQSPGALDPSVVWEEIGLRGRSMLEIMQVLSKHVHVPAEHIERGEASADRQSATDGSYLVIKSSKSEPPNSSLRIMHHGHWFYIENSDLQSRETFAMLNALFAVVGGKVPGAHPVLTLPVGQ